MLIFLDFVIGFLCGAVTLALWAICQNKNDDEV